MKWLSNFAFIYICKRRDYLPGKTRPAYNRHPLSQHFGLVLDIAGILPFTLADAVRRKVNQT
jgi:hypothetical protein